jgi:hypothetical protein
MVVAVPGLVPVPQAGPGNLRDQRDQRNQRNQRNQRDQPSGLFSALYCGLYGGPQDWSFQGIAVRAKLEENSKVAQSRGSTGGTPFKSTGCSTGCSTGEDDVTWISCIFPDEADSCVNVVRSVLALLYKECTSSGATPVSVPVSVPVSESEPSAGLSDDQTKKKYHDSCDGSIGSIGCSGSVGCSGSSGSSYDSCGATTDDMSVMSVSIDSDSESSGSLCTAAGMVVAEWARGHVCPCVGSVA